MRLMDASIFTKRKLKVSLKQPSQPFANFHRLNKLGTINLYNRINKLRINNANTSQLIDFMRLIIIT